MRRFALLFAVTTTLACSPAPTPRSGPAPMASAGQAPRSVTVASAPPPSASASAVPAPPAPKERVLTMHRVMQVWSLIDLWRTDDGIELRLGLESVGGSLGWFRYVPLVNGVPDLDRETGRDGYANTAWLRRSTTNAGNFIEVLGKRPALITHKVSGFRSVATDSYRRLDENRQWVHFNVPTARGIGIAIERWSKNRWLEWRAPDPETPGESAYVPSLRMLGFGEGQPPTIPAALQKRLTAEGFQLATFEVLQAGPVIAVGRRTLAKGYGTIVWEDPANPKYTVIDTPLDEEAELTLLGGQQLSELRLLAEDRVMKLDRGAWVEESKLDAAGLPDVWFGAPLLHHRQKATWARTAKDAPWMRVQFHSEDKFVNRTFVVDAAGTIWMNEDDILYANVKPSTPQPDVTEEVIVKGRKRSLLREGSPDVTGKPPMHTFGLEKCRAHYLVIFRADKNKSLKSDIVRAARALKGQKELVGRPFSRVVEGTLQFFGVRIEGTKIANQLYSIVRKKVSGSNVDLMCAEPPIAEKVNVDIKTGRVLP